jgi:hypothetical protein
VSGDLEIHAHPGGDRSSELGYLRIRRSQHFADLDLSVHFGKLENLVMDLLCVLLTYFVPLFRHHIGCHVLHFSLQCLSNAQFVEELDE